MKGDGEIVAHLNELKSRNSLGKVALMMRSTLAAPSIWAGLVRLSDGRTGFQARRETNGKVAGAFESISGQWMKLVRQRNAFFIRPTAGTQLSEGEPLDILGFLEWRNGDVFLGDARIRTPDGIGVPRVLASLSESGMDDEIRDVAIKDLVAEDERAELEARLGVRFRIRGVTTFVGTVASDPLYFVQDASGSCLVRLWGGTPRASFEAGQLVELTGPVSGRSPIPELKSSRMCHSRHHKPACAA